MGDELFELARDALGTVVRIDQHEGVRELCREPGECGACRCDRAGVRRHCPDCGGELFEAGEVVRSARARYRVDEEAVPRVRGDHRLLPVAVEGGVEHGGGDCVAPPPAATINLVMQSAYGFEGLTSHCKICRCGDLGYVQIGVVVAVYRSVVVQGVRREAMSHGTAAQEGPGRQCPLSSMSDVHVKGPHLRKFGGGGL